MIVIFPKGKIAQNVSNILQSAQIPVTDIATLSEYIYQAGKQETTVSVFQLSDHAVTLLTSEPVELMMTPPVFVVGVEGLVYSHSWMTAIAGYTVHTSDEFLRSHAARPGKDVNIVSDRSSAVLNDLTRNIPSDSLATEPVAPAPLTLTALLNSRDHKNRSKGD